MKTNKISALVFISIISLVAIVIILLNRYYAPVPRLSQTLKTHYLIDQEYIIDEKQLFSTIGHLLVFNPSNNDADLKITLYFENEQPKSFNLKAPAKKSFESNYETWEVKPKPNSNFALKVESTQPVICQSTIGWNNTANDYTPQAKTKSPKGVRETAKSYMSITQLSRDWFVADGIIINNPSSTWLKESEWMVLLNPNPDPVEVSIYTKHGKKGALQKPELLETLVIEGERVKKILMDSKVPQNKLYGVRAISKSPIAVQWLRNVNWYDSPELMAFWSTPAVPNIDFSD